MNTDVKNILDHITSKLENEIVDPIEIKTICENMRSTFDYCIKDIGKKCFNKKIEYFPYSNAEKNENEVSFLKKVLFTKGKGTRKSKGILYTLSDLKREYKSIYDNICSIQSFSGDNWLYLLFRITNKAKHEELPKTFGKNIGGFLFLSNHSSMELNNCFVNTKSGSLPIGRTSHVSIKPGMSANQIWEQLNPDAFQNQIIYCGDNALIIDNTILEINPFLQKCRININDFMNNIYRIIYI